MTETTNTVSAGTEGSKPAAENSGMLKSLLNLLFGKDRDISRLEINEMTRRDKLSPSLPWIAYDPDTRAYHNIDDTVGFIWECSPLAFAGEQTIKTLEGLFRIGIPNGSIMQFILYADKYIEDCIEQYKNSKTRNLPVVKEAAERFSRFLLDGVNGLDILQRMPIRDFRLFVCLKMPPKNDNGSDINLLDIYSNVNEILKGARLQPEALIPEGLVDWMRKVFNDRPSGNNGHYNEGIPINRQVIFSDTVITKTMSHIKMGKRYFRCTTVKNYPKEVDAFQTNELFGGVWGVTSDANQILTPFLYSLNIVFQNLKMKLHMKCNLVLQQQYAGSFAPSLMRKKDEYMRAVDDIEKGVPFVRIIPTMWVWSEDEKLAAESIARIKRMWEAKGYVMQEDKGILPPLFIASMPFGLYFADGENIDNLERDFTAPGDAVALTLPVQADFAGGGPPQLLFVGRKGQPIGIDFFGKGVGNYNAFIAAASGSGKSFTINNIIYNYYAANAMIRVIDIGGSYRKMSGLFNAKYLDFHARSNICLNPFTFVDMEDVDFQLRAVVGVIVTMCFSSTDIIPADIAETAMSLIKAAVRWAWSQEGTDATVDTVYRYLASFPEYATGEFGNGNTSSFFRDTAQTLAFNLTEFTSGHSYGKWFNRRSNFNIADDEFVVLELESLKPQPELFKVVMLLVIDAVTKNLYLSDRSRMKLVVFDESWQFIKEGSAQKDVIEEGYRRARKYNGSFTVITQSINDLKQFGSVGSVIMANSAFKIYLESSDFDRAKSENLIDYGNFGMELLKSIRKAIPKYSEIFLDTPYGQGPARLIVDPFSYYLYTSDPGEVSEIDRIIEEQGLDYKGAILEMMRKYRSGGANPG
ncbi:MAG: TraC family protein [Syntrophales bacterium]